MAENETEEGVEVELIAQARALHAYVPTPSDEDQSLVFLSFQKGDMIDVIEMHESGWWEGCCNDTIGLFPGSYVEVVERFLSSKDGATTQSESDDKKEEKKEEKEEEKKEEKVEEKKEEEEKVEETKVEEKKEEEKKEEVAVEGEKALFQARRFALHFKALLEAQVADAATKKESYDKLLGENATLRGEKQAAEARVKELEATGGTEGNNDELTKQVEMLKSSETELKAQITTLQGQVETANKQAEAPTPAAESGKVEQLEGQVTTLTAEVKEKTEAIAALQKEVEEAKAAAPAAAPAETPAPAADDGKVVELEGQVTTLTAQVAALQKEVEEAKAAAPAEAPAAEDSGKVVELEGQVTTLTAQVTALQKEVEEAKAAAPAEAAVDPAAMDALNAELKLAKQQRMGLQTKVEEMDMELRNAMDRATDLQKQLDSGVTTGELGDAQVLEAELKMAKQQRQALQSKVDEMDFELRQALDDANEANTLKAKLEEAEKKLAAGGGGGEGGEEAKGGVSEADFEEEKKKRTRFESQVKDLKKELEDAKKASGSSSIMQIKMQAMEKEVAKARKALETATTGPAQQIEELTKETKDLKMKAKKLESELEVALNRAAANEEAQKQKLELRAELEEMREAKNKGKDMTEEVKKTPTYKLEKLEKENAELKEKLAAHMSGTSTPVGSPMVKRAVKKPSPANSPRSSDAESVKIKELEEKVAEQTKKISELEANVKDTSTPRKLVGSGLQSELQQELNEAQLQIAKKDRELSQLQSQLQETTLQLSRAGMNAGAGPAKGPAKAPHKAPMKKMFLKKKMGPKTPVAPKKAP